MKAIATVLVSAGLLGFVLASGTSMLVDGPGEELKAELTVLAFLFCLQAFVFCLFGLVRRLPFLMQRRRESAKAGQESMDHYHERQTDPEIAAPRQFVQ